MSALVDLLGPTLAKKGGTVPTAEALAGKSVVALYFSAHWCPPCRQFTPMLGQAYTKDLAAKGMEVVFVSSDRDESGFDGYFGEQPWLALPYADRAKKASLSKKYKVNGIPTLVILDGATGETITTEGREKVSRDPTGQDFPWKPPTFWEALGDEFLQGVDGEVVEVDDLKGPGKYIGLYFSAHWCPPCRQFTPALVSAYKDHLKAKNLEIIFVSSDRSGSDFTEYYKTMPWLAIPNGDPRKEVLSSRFGVQGIPTFVVVDAETGETVSANARGSVMSDPTGAEFPWAPKPLVNLKTEAPEGINEETALMVMLEGCDAPTTAAAVAVLEKVAETAKAAKEEMLFFYAPAGSQPQMMEQIRSLTKLGSATSTPQMLILDIPDEGGFYVSPATEVTAETVSGFLNAYKAKALERLQMGR